MATTLGFKRFLAAILAAATVACAVPAAAGNWMPLLPDQDFYDFQLFAPPNLQEYSIYRDAPEGLFFNYDRLYWGMTRPRFSPVAQGFDTVGGVPTSLMPTQPVSASSIVSLNNQLSALGITSGSLIVFGTDELLVDLNTTWMQTAMSWGNRFEFGWIYDDYGAKFDYFDSGMQSQSFSTFNQFAVNSPFTQLQTNVAVAVVGVDIQQTLNAVSPQPDHVITQDFVQRNETRIQSGAAVALIRRHLGNRGSAGHATFSFGPRFLQLEDRFSLLYSSTTAPFNSGSNNVPSSVTITSTGGGANTTGTGGNIPPGVNNGTVVGTQLAYQNASWDTHTINNVVGPEFGVHLESTRGRWSFNADLKFTAGFNWQNNMYQGANLPETLAADYVRSTFQFSQEVDEVTSAPPLIVQVFGLQQQNATNDAEYAFVFSPIGEWRLGTEFRVSQAISLNLGYTGMWLGSVARASTNTGYNTVRRPVPAAAAPNTPENPSGEWAVVTRDVPFNRIGPTSGGQQNLFVNGIDFGININY